MLRGALLALAVAVLVGGAIFVGGRTPTAGSGLAALIEAGDAQTIAELVVPGTLPNVPTAQIVSVLDARFGGGETVASTRVLTVQGTRLIEVVTTGDPRGGPPLVLCERPDGGVLISCRAATATLTVESAPDAYSVQFAGVELFGDEAQVQLVIVNEGDAPVTISRPFALSANGQVIDAEGNAAELGQFGPTGEIEGDAELAPGSALLVGLTVTGDAVSSLLSGTLTVSLGADTVALSIGEVTSFLR